jgi:PAS domain S-box-containing protein
VDNIQKLTIDDCLKYRCFNCKKTLCLSKPKQDSLEIKCLRCGNVNEVFKQVYSQIIITDKEGKILFVNGEFEKITGYKSEEVVGKTPALWGKQMPKSFYKELWRIIKEEKKSVEALLTNKNKSGKLYNVKLHISPVLDLKGKIKFFVGIETLIKDKIPKDNNPIEQ